MLWKCAGENLKNLFMNKINFVLELKLRNLSECFILVTLQTQYIWHLVINCRNRTEGDAELDLKPF